MNTIRNKIQATFVITILILGVFAGMMLLVNQLNAFENQKIIQTMTTEYSLISLSDNLIGAYNNVVKNPGNVQFQTNYQELRTKLLRNILLLKQSIKSQESKILLIGVESIINQVILECDTGLKEIKANNFQNFSDHFAIAHKKNEFIQTNTSILLQKELEFLSNIEERSRQTYLISILSSAGIFALVLFVLILFSHSFSKQIVRPIEQLTKSVEQVSGGKMDVLISGDLTKQKDEVGVLSRSFAKMVANINDMILKLSSSNKEIEESKMALETSNVELKKINEFMVDREQKMIELKNRIHELEALTAKT